MMFMPKPAALSAMARPMRPYPRMPRVAPRVRCIGWSRATCSPAAGFDLGVVLAEATVEGEDHPDGVVGDFVHAVVGDVGDDDAELGSGWDVDVVHSDAISGGNHALFGGFEDVAGDLSEAEHYHISIGRQPGEGRF